MKKPRRPEKPVDMGARALAEYEEVARRRTRADLVSELRRVAALQDWKLSEKRSDR